MSFAAMTTTPGFLGSLSSRDEKLDAYHNGHQETREVEKQNVKEDE